MHNQNIVFDSFQYWQKPRNTNWIHEDGSKPFCMGWGQTVSQKPPLSLSSVLEARTYQSSGHCSINTGRLESRSFLRQIYWMRVLATPGGFSLRVTQMYQAYHAWAVGWCWPQAQAYLWWQVWSCRRSTSGFSQGFMFILVIVLSKADQQKMQWNKVQSDKRTRVFWHQTFPSISKTYSNNKIISSGIPSTGYQAWD